MKYKTNDKYVYRTYRNISLIATLIIGYYILFGIENTNIASQYISMSDGGKIVIIVLHCVEICMMIPILNLSKRINVSISNTYYYKFSVNKKKMHIFMFVVFVAEIVFTLTTGNLRLFAESTSKLSFVFNLLRPSLFMPIYYIVGREKKVPLYWVNIFLYMFFQAICGWSAFILQVFFLELFCYMRERKKPHRVITGLWKVNSLAVVFLLMIGALFYRFAYAFKMHIRMGYEFKPISFSDSLGRLVARLTNVSDSILAFQNASIIAELYHKQGLLFAEVLSIFKPILPRFIMPNKEFSTMSNFVWESVWSNISNTTGTGFDFLIYLFCVARTSIILFLVLLLVFIILFVATKKFIYMFDSGNSEMDMAFFLYEAQICTGTSLANVAVFLPCIYMIPIMLAFGVINLKKNPKKYIDNRGEKIEIVKKEGLS